MKMFRFRCVPIKGWAIILWAGGLLLALAATCAAVPVSQGASLVATVEKSTATVGELLWLTLDYTLPQGSRLTDEPFVGGLEDLRIVEQVVDTEKIRVRFVVDQLASLETGIICLAYLDEDGKEQQIESDPVVITVTSNLGKKPEEATLRPIQDILPTGSGWFPFLAWIVVGIVLIGIIAGLWWRRKQRFRQMDQATAKPPHIRAEQEINRLVTGGLFERGEVKAFYFQFSEILRRYMGAIRGFAAVEMTTEEIVRRIGSHSQDQMMLPLLRQAELVKFADLVPTRHGKDQDVLSARNYIRETRPTPADGESQEEGA